MPFALCTAAGSEILMAARDFLWIGFRRGHSTAGVSPRECLRRSASEGVPPKACRRLHFLGKKVRLPLLFMIKCV